MARTEVGAVLDSVGFTRVVAGFAGAVVGFAVRKLLDEVTDENSVSSVSKVLDMHASPLRPLLR